MTETVEALAKSLCDRFCRKSGYTDDVQTEHWQMLTLGYLQEAQTAIDTLQSLGWLSPDQLAIRDAETTRRALELASDWHDQQFLGFKQERDDFLKKHEQNRAPMKSTDRFLGLAITAENKMNYHFDSCKAIRALRPAPTGWKLVPEEPTEAMLDAGIEIPDWTPIDCYRAMIGSVK